MAKLIIIQTSHNGSGLMIMMIVMTIIFCLVLGPDRLSDHKYRKIASARSQLSKLNTDKCQLCHLASDDPDQCWQYIAAIALAEPS